MRAHSIWLILMVAVMALVGCGEESASPESGEPGMDQPTPDQRPDDRRPDDPRADDPSSDPDVPVWPDDPMDDPALTPTPVDTDPGAEVDLVPPPLEATRALRRMDLDQLDATLRQVTGGIGWTEVRGGREVNLFVELAGTLGKPDYIEITSESLEPSALFQKFLGDAARSVCDRLIERDLRLPMADRILMSSVEAEDDLDSAAPRIDANLRALLLRFHGRHLPPGDPLLEGWTWMFETVLHVTDEPVDAWEAICVGLITHPDFYTY